LPIREQMGIILIALVISFVMVSWRIGVSPGEGVRRLGYDLPDVLYPYRSGEGSNRYRFSAMPKRDFERIEIQTFWFLSKPVPNSTKAGVKPTTDRIEALLALTDRWVGDNPVETEVEYEGSRVKLLLYDFSGMLRLARTPPEASPSCFAFLLDEDSSIVAYFEGFSDFFPFSGRTISLLRLTRKGSCEEFGPPENPAVEKHLDEGPLYGLWVVNKPRRNEVLEVSVLLSENARLVVEAEWSRASEKMQIVSMVVDGERYNLWASFV